MDIYEMLMLELCNDSSILAFEIGKPNRHGIFRIKAIRRKK